MRVGETDAIATLITQEFGKIALVAKGVRSITSAKRATLEPGNLVTCYCIKTKSLPIITQTKLIADCSLLPHTLKNFRQLSEILEIFDLLFVEEELDIPTYSQVLEIRERVIATNFSSKAVRESLSKLITQLGFQHPDETDFASITEYVSSLVEHPLKSYTYLKIKN